VKADSLPRRFIALAIAWLLVAAFLVFQFWPDLPKSYLQWLLLVVFGPPLYVLGEAFFGWLFSLRHGQSISPRPFSPIRILVALPVVLAFLALSWWLSWLLTRAA
jgi:hypothetical protein